MSLPLASPAGRRRTKSALATVIAALSLTVALLSSRCLAQGAVLDGIRSYEQDQSLVIAIDLSVEAHYVSHAWALEQSEVRLRFRRLNVADEESVAATGRSQLQATGPLAKLVSDVSVDGNNGVDLAVTVRFTQPVQATVYQAADQRSVFLEIPLSSIPDSGLETESKPTPVTDAQTNSISAASPSAETQPSDVVPDSFELSGNPMIDARRAMTANDYPAAIRYLTKVLRSPDSPDAQAAKELLGVARERNHQLAHAKAEYQEYLEAYPEGEGADRVRQRLAGLVSFNRKARNRGPGDPSEPREARPWADARASGSLSQYYRQDSTVSDDAGSGFTRSFVDSNLDLVGRLRTDTYDSRLTLSGSYRTDIEGGGSRSNARLRYLYADLGHRTLGVNTRIGRQSRSTGGVQGRFDGALLSYSGVSPLRFNLVGGSPVNFSRSNDIDTDRYFYGLSLDIGTLAEHWDTSIFFIEQQADGTLDRRAVGGELRYVDRHASLFTLVDYDISFQDLNTFLLFGNYRFDNASTLSLSVDLRSSPALRTSNALIGQEVQSIDELADMVGGMGEVRGLAEDRTTQSRSLTVSGSYPLTEDTQVTTDLTLSQLSGSPESGGVPATPSTGIEYFWYGQLLVTNLLFPGDFHILGLRYANTGTTDTAGVLLNDRFPKIWGWRINPRLRFDLQRRVADTLVSVVRPSLLLDYRWGSSLSIDLEGGYEWLEEISGETRGIGRQNYYLYLGYRWDF